MKIFYLETPFYSAVVTAENLAFAIRMVKDNISTLITTVSPDVETVNTIANMPQVHHIKISQNQWRTI